MCVSDQVHGPVLSTEYPPGSIGRPTLLICCIPLPRVAALRPSGMWRAGSNSCIRATNNVKFSESWSRSTAAHKESLRLSTSSSCLKCTLLAPWASHNKASTSFPPTSRQGYPSRRGKDGRRIHGAAAAQGLCRLCCRRHGGGTSHRRGRYPCPDMHQSIQTTQLVSCSSSCPPKSVASVLGG